MKNINIGQLIFIKDTFFKLIKDQHLMKNKEHSKRPHFFAFQDKDDKNLFWVVPASSKIKKYDAISKYDKKAKDVLLKVKIRRRISYLLFADMFPVLKYYTFPYINNDNPVYINRRNIPKALNYAKKTLSRLNHGMNFGPTFPDLSYIKNKEIKLERRFKNN